MNPSTHSLELSPVGILALRLCRTDSRGDGSINISLQFNAEEISSIKKLHTPIFESIGEAESNHSEIGGSELPLPINIRLQPLESKGLPNRLETKKSEEIKCK